MVFPDNGETRSDDEDVRGIPLLSSQPSSPPLLATRIPNADLEGVVMVLWSASSPPGGGNVGRNNPFTGVWQHSVLVVDEAFKASLEDKIG